MSATTLAAAPARNKQIGFVVAWAVCLLVYSGQYALHSAPGVMPEVMAQFGLTALGVSSLIGLFHDTNSTFAIIARGAMS